MKRLSEEGNRIYILILGEGITSRQVKRETYKVSKEIKKLHAEVKAASEIVGAISCKVLNFPDNRFDSVDLLDIVKEIVNMKKKIKPEIVFTHHGNDLNIDHRITFNAVLTACRPLHDETVKEIYSFEVPSSTEWQYQNDQNIFKPVYYIKLEKRHVQAKLKAMQNYSTEKRKSPHPRSPEALVCNARNRGANVSSKYAECFEIIRKID